METSDSLFDIMRENYLSMKRDIRINFKSDHWDVFNDDFESLIEKKEIWPRMLRNALTLGFNDNLLKISNKRFSGNKENLWKELKGGDHEDLIFDFKLDDKRNQDYYIRAFKIVAKATDIDFVSNNCMSDVGKPVALNFYLGHNDEKKLINCNLHDLSDIRHSWIILNELKKFKLEKPLICEIGAGYGGLATKIKNNLPSSRIILFDLPEVTTVQTYYLTQVFPEKNILGYQDYKDLGLSILDRDFDFLILPGWTISQLLHKDSADVFINIRSMMEMNKSTLEFYFNAIQTSLKSGGIFACFNRYAKRVGKDFLNRLDQYPFDNHWKIIISQKCIFQEKMHQFILEREKKDNNSGFKEVLKDIRFLDIVE